MYTFVVINRQHRILPEQYNILKKEFGKFYKIQVPPEGWTLTQQMSLVEKLSELADKHGINVVFISPVPLLIALLSYESALRKHIKHAKPLNVYIFHNDKRIKKELPDGRVISVIPEEGWKLVEVV